MEAADSSVTLVHLPDYTAHTENLSNTMTTMLALFRAVIVLWSENQAKYNDTVCATTHSFRFQKFLRITTTVGGESLEKRVWKQYRQLI